LRRSISALPLEDALDGQILRHYRSFSRKDHPVFKTGNTGFGKSRAIPPAKNHLVFKANVINDGMLITTEDITEMVELSSKTPE